MYKTKHNFFFLFLEIPRAIKDASFRLFRWKSFLNFVKRDLKFKVRVKVNKQNCIYGTHLTFRVRYWKLLASSAFSWFQRVMTTLSKSNTHLLNDWNISILLLKSVKCWNSTKKLIIKISGRIFFVMIAN